MEALAVQGAITGYIDVAQLVLYVFWLFFAGLIWYLHRENKREGYPLVNDRSGRVLVQGYPPIPEPKTFLLSHGRQVSVPRAEAPETLNAVPAAYFPGAPLIPVGDPMLAAMGPGSFAQRADEPDVTYDDEKPKIVPLRAAPSFFLAWEDPDPRGYTVMGCDGVVAGRVLDAWVDRSEVVIRYLEVALEGAGATGSVLLPMNFVEFRHKQKVVGTRYIRGAQFAQVPRTKHPDIVTLLEEDRILAFFGGGMLYATPRRAESLL
jgi:photosynthetic reaction center H subunit